MMLSMPSQYLQWVELFLGTEAWAQLSLSTTQEKMKKGKWDHLVLKATTGPVNWGAINLKSCNIRRLTLHNASLSNLVNRHTTCSYATIKTCNGQLLHPIITGDKSVTGWTEPRENHQINNQALTQAANMTQELQSLSQARSNFKSAFAKELHQENVQRNSPSWRSSGYF